ncbi:MAG: hypothetical protein R3E50_14645 [Halioglobus sp.]
MDTQGRVHARYADAYIAGKRNPVVMLTTDLALLREDLAYRKVTERLSRTWRLSRTLACAWFKLTHVTWVPRPAM